MALDKLDNDNTLRATFRCANPIQMAFLKGHLESLAQVNAHAGFTSLTAETCVFEVDIATRLAAFEVQGLRVDRADMIAAMKEYIENIEAEYDKAEIISFHVPQAS